MASPSSAPRPRSPLVALLRDRREELIRRWTQRVVEDPRVPEASRLSEPELRDHVPELLDRIADEVEAGAPRALGAGQSAREHARHRAAEGYGLVEALRELSHFRAAILGLCAEEGVPLEDGAAEVLHAAIDESMTSGADEMERAAAGARRESEARLRAIVDNAVDAIVTIDERGTIETLNPTAERLFGYRARELVGQNVKVLMPEPYRRAHDDYLTHYRQTSERRIIGVGREVEGRHKSGATFPIDLAVSESWIGGRRVFTGMLRDITDRKAAEAERDHLLESERTARSEAERAAHLRDEFVATVSHELRTPLNAILGWAGMLRSGKLDAAATAKALEVIDRNAKAQATLVEDLLDISRIGSGKLRLEVREVNLAAIVENVVASHLPSAEAKGVLVDKAADDATCTVLGDPGRLEQIVSNLLSNAIKFTPRGGRVEVICRRAGSWVEIVVRDTGKGIDADFLPAVFDRFRQAEASLTRHHRGLGLGLTLVKFLVEQHGGQIRAESEGEGRGATFTVTLPIVAAVSTGAQRSPIEASGALAGLRALVVDDEEDARTLLRRILEDCRAEVTLAGSAAEALEQLPRVRPDVLISDIGMPELDGYQLIRAARALGPEQGGATPAVALTAFARPEDRLRAIEAGYQMHVAKPVDQGELLLVIADVTGRLPKPPVEDAAAEE